MRNGAYNTVFENTAWYVAYDLNLKRRDGKDQLLVHSKKTGHNEFPRLWVMPTKDYKNSPKFYRRIYTKRVPGVNAAVFICIYDRADIVQIPVYIKEIVYNELTSSKKIKEFMKNYYRGITW